MFTNNTTKHLAIIVMCISATIPISNSYCNTHKLLAQIREGINVKEDIKQLSKEKNTMMCFIDITHEAIKNNTNLQENISAITEKHMQSIKDSDIKYVMLFLDGDNKTQLETLSKHIDSVYNSPDKLHIFRSVLAKIIKDIQNHTDIKKAITAFLKKIEEKEPLFNKLKYIEHYSDQLQEQKDIINSKNATEALNIISKISSKHLISNHNLGNIQ